MRYFKVFMVVAVALGAVACSDPAKDLPKAAIEANKKPVTVEQVAATDGKLVYSINGDNSKLEWTGSKVTGKHDGGFKKFKGTAETPTGKVEHLKLAVEIDIASLYSDDEKLTAHLLSKDFFGVETNPTASFLSTVVAKGEGDNWNVSGSLELNNHVQHITFPATIGISPEGLKVKAAFSINRKDFGMSYPGIPDNLIRDDVAIRIDVKASLVE